METGDFHERWNPFVDHDCRLCSSSSDLDWGCAPNVCSSEVVYVLVCYMVTSILAFWNAYGRGLTNWCLAPTYGKLGLFIVLAWACSNGSVMVGLAVCGVMMTIISTTSDITQDFKMVPNPSIPVPYVCRPTHWDHMGCLLAALTIWLFYKAFDIGNPTGQYKAPYTIVFQSMALIGVESFDVLSSHCLQLCYGLLAAGIVISLVRVLSPKHVAKCIQISLAMAIPIYIGGYFAIDMFIRESCPLCI